MQERINLLDNNKIVICLVSFLPHLQIPCVVAASSISSCKSSCDNIFICEFTYKSVGMAEKYNGTCCIIIINI